MVIKPIFSLHENTFSIRQNKLERLPAESILSILPQTAQVHHLTVLNFLGWTTALPKILGLAKKYLSRTNALAYLTGPLAVNKKVL
jgi:hypothetical protein